MNRSDRYWADCLVSNKVATFVSVSDAGEDTGVVVVAPYDNEAGLFAMWVCPGSRKFGIGAHLVTEAVGWARKREYSRILLDVADDNTAAIALYESHGFKPTGATGTLAPPREHITEHQRSLRLNQRCEQDAAMKDQRKSE